MSANHDLERRLADHYEAEAPAHAPAWVLERALASVDATGQRRTLLGPRTRPTRPRLARFAAALGATAVLGVAVVALGVSISRPDVAAPPSPTPSASSSVEPSGARGPLWPQTSLEEVRAAQALADAGDPASTWQLFLDPIQIAQHHPRGAERFFGRFIEEVLGWEKYLWHESFAHPDGNEDGDVVYVRCAPDRADPLYPSDPLRPDCAPTLDAHRFETVRINVAQPDRTGTRGIWVVTRWEIIDPAATADPVYVEAQGRAMLERFLQARRDGTSAEGLARWPEGDTIAAVRADRSIPLLYATTGGSAYERWEVELVDGPRWPDGFMRFVVTLFAEDGETVVEQGFSVEPDARGDLRLAYDLRPMPPFGRVAGTRENGRSVPAAYAFLGGAVTYRAAYPTLPDSDIWGQGPNLANIVDTSADPDRRLLVLLADPRPIGMPNCDEAPAPASAAELAESIGSNPAFEALEPVAAAVDEVPALQIDLTLRSIPIGCAPVLLKDAPFGVGDAPPPNGSRARLYLLDLPEGRVRVLAIAVIADGDSFEEVLASATPILESIEIQAP